MSELFAFSVFFFFLSFVVSPVCVLGFCPLFPFSLVSRAVLAPWPLCVGFSLSLFVPVCCLLFSPSSELGGLKGGGGFGLVVVFCSCLGVLLSWCPLSSFLPPSQVASELELGMGITHTPS